MNSISIEFNDHMAAVTVPQNLSPSNQIRDILYDPICAHRYDAQLPGRRTGKYHHDDGTFSLTLARIACSFSSAIRTSRSASISFSSARNRAWDSGKTKVGRLDSALSTRASGIPGSVGRDAPSFPSAFRHQRPTARVEGVSEPTAARAQKWPVAIVPRGRARGRRGWSYDLGFPRPTVAG